jgi:AmmeMemoRadiSam system protein A
MAHGEHHPVVELARATIDSYVREGKVIAVPKALAPEMEEKAGVFVSLHKGEALRGCIGTIQPQQPNVAHEVIQNAISAATQDPRFPPVQASELAHLEISVDILQPAEPIESMEQLDPRRYGVIVQSGWRRGLLLPDLEGVDTAEYQVEIARRKAGISPHESVQLYRFEVKRYH